MTTANSNTANPEDVVFENVNTAKWDCMMLNPLLDRAIMNVLNRNPSAEEKQEYDELVALLDASLNYSKKLLDTISHIESFEFKIRKIGGSKSIPDTDESRAGAIACMDALRTIERIAGINQGGMSMDAWWALQDDCTKAMLNAAGKPSAFITGFVSVFAEYVFNLNSSGHPNLDKWKSEATMTKEEKADHRADFIRRVAEGEKIAA